MPESVVLVSPDDCQRGVCEKISAHRQGLLHRAFSVWVVNSKGEILVQQRALGKYHCGGIWANTCCSHPRPGEDVIAAMHRRLKDEMGFDCSLEEKVSFIYKVQFDNGLEEHEFLHVGLGMWDGTPLPKPSEVMAWKWISIPDLEREIRLYPGKYSYWLIETLPRIRQWLKSAL